MSIAPEHTAKRRPDWPVLGIAAALAVVAVVLFWDAGQLNVRGFAARFGPAIFPRLIGGLLLILAVWTAIDAWRGNPPPREKDDLPPIAWIVGGLAAQMLLLTTAGFSIATGLLFAATVRGFGRGPLWKTVPIGVVFAFMVWFIFSQGLDLTLPAGPLEKLLTGA
ncbi:tripartite tricarboxylate transporter TctB family protein [Inquilinus limosus]|uniref:C4-dicarboxylate ABC transporter n=1 Tax=Inquilinus limosus MP06 TaxID=1398085 RepID=A0A0A0D8B8_9PROT|nr:tripartite tricarboxylate transporter TctB family protein [Inquilinus limosus]KGM34093.1 C4-dicarboxylate ABC transporter [Inquilinus limosus MP06]